MGNWEMELLAAHKHIVIAGNFRDGDWLRRQNEWSPRNTIIVTPSNPERLRGLRGPLDVHRGYFPFTYSTSNHYRDGWEEIEHTLHSLRAIFGPDMECPTKDTNRMEHDN